MKAIRMPGIRQSAAAAAIVTLVVVLGGCEYDRGNGHGSYNQDSRSPNYQYRGNDHGNGSNRYGDQSNNRYRYGDQGNNRYRNGDNGDKGD